MKITMPGEFNVKNALCAIAMTYAVGIPPEAMEKALAVARTAGRMQVFKSEDEKDKQSLREQLREANARNVEDAQRANDEIASLKAQLKEAGQPIIQQVVPPDTAEEMARLRAQAGRGQAEASLRALRDVVWDGWQKLMAQLDTLEAAGGDPDGKYRAGIRKLAALMGEQAERRNMT